MIFKIPRHERRTLECPGCRCSRHNHQMEAAFSAVVLREVLRPSVPKAREGSCHGCAGEMRETQSLNPPGHQPKSHSPSAAATAASGARHSHKPV